MRSFSRPPCPALAPFVEQLWYFEGDLPPGRERILPSAKMQLFVNLHEDEIRTYEGDGFARVIRIGGSVLAGADSRVFAIDTAEQREIVGVAFRPGGTLPFFRLPAHTIAEQSVTLDDVWGRDGAVVRERLLEAGSPEATLTVLEKVLLQRSFRALEPDRAIVHAAKSLAAGRRVGEITKELGMTPRRFIARFSEVVGLPPKLFARVRRFQQVLEAVENGQATSWAQIAAFAGYFDQSHLIRDFSEFSGIVPSAYESRGLGMRNHVPL